MNIQAFLQENIRILEEAHIASARLDCLILLEDMLNIDRSFILAHPEMEPSDVQISILNKYITRRKRQEPLAYIRGRSEFYGREFKVNKFVLVPRPESEDMITILTALPLALGARIADIGTGSGCLGITAKLEVPTSEVYLFDISRNALAMAEKNAQLHKTTIHLKQQNLLENTVEQFDVILANLPYVPNDYPINEAASHEPKLALFSGPNGLDHYQVFWKQISELSHKPAYIITESMALQHKALLDLAKGAHYELAKTAGLVQLFSR